MQPSTTPLVTVWITTRNRAQLLERAVNSVIQQTYPNIEIIIVDDHSSDETTHTIESFKEQYSFIQSIHFEENKGACAARNAAIKQASGFYLTGLDDDDEFSPERINKLVQSYDSKYSFICSGYYWKTKSRKRRIHCSNKIISLQNILSYNYASNQIMTTKERLIKSGLFDEHFVACQDWDMWTRLIENFGSAKRIPDCLYTIHTDGSNDRLSINGERKIRGFEQYVSKHEHLMNKRNKNNIAFVRIMKKQGKFTLKEFIRLFSFSLFYKQMGYFVRSNFFTNKI